MLSADAALSEDVACPNEITKVGGKKKEGCNKRIKKQKNIHTLAPCSPDGGSLQRQFRYTRIVTSQRNAKTRTIRTVIEFWNFVCRTFFFPNKDVRPNFIFIFNDVFLLFMSVFRVANVVAKIGLLNSTIERNAWHSVTEHDVQR